MRDLALLDNRGAGPRRVLLGERGAQLLRPERWRAGGEEPLHDALHRLMLGAVLERFARRLGRRFGLGEQHLLPREETLDVLRYR